MWIWFRVGTFNGTYSIDVLQGLFNTLTETHTRSFDFTQIRSKGGVLGNPVFKKYIIEKYNLMLLGKADLIVQPSNNVIKSKSLYERILQPSLLPLKYTQYFATHESYTQRLSNLPLKLETSWDKRLALPGCKPKASPSFDPEGKIGYMSTYPEGGCEWRYEFKQGSPNQGVNPIKNEPQRLILYNPTDIQVDDNLNKKNKSRWVPNKKKPLPPLPKESARRTHRTFEYDRGSQTFSSTPFADDSEVDLSRLPETTAHGTPVSYTAARKIKFRVYRKKGDFSIATQTNIGGKQVSDSLEVPECKFDEYRFPSENLYLEDDLSSVPGIRRV